MGGFGGRGGPMTDEQRQQFLQVRVDRLKETLGATDEEWNVLKDAITSVVNLSGDQMKASQALRDAVGKEGATNDELKAALDTYRKATKAVTDKRPALQAKLKELVTPKQEAQLVLQGILD
jgi:chromosome segregation ATPase